MTGQPYKTNLDGNIQKLVILQNNCFMPGGHFKFDENTDTVDSYILKMSQVAAMLNLIWLKEC